MSVATSSTGRSIAAHAVLAGYTIICLFPVILVIINSFKTRRETCKESETHR